MIGELARLAIGTEGSSLTRISAKSLYTNINLTSPALTVIGGGTKGRGL
jgi:hypothetical protein